MRLLRHKPSSKELVNLSLLAHMTKFTLSVDSTCGNGSLIVTAGTSQKFCVFHIRPLQTQILSYKPEKACMSLDSHPKRMIYRKTTKHFRNNFLDFPTSGESAQTLSAEYNTGFVETGSKFLEFPPRTFLISINRFIT